MRLRTLPAFRALAIAVCGAALVAFSAARAEACPFCSAVAMTLSEEIETSNVAVIGKLVYTPPAETDPDSFDAPKSTFEITRVLKGAEGLGKTRLVDVVYFGTAKLGDLFLILGIEPPEVSWGTPIALSERAEKYLIDVMALPKEGTERLVFFQEYLEDKDETLSRDAYDEFARTPYAAVRAAKDHMHHDQLVEWIKNAEIPASRRRLYLTMLGVCGTPNDVPMLEEMIRSSDRKDRGALDALIGAYLTLKGPGGLSLVEDLFLKKKDAEYTDTYATIIALRVLGEEKILPREPLLGAMRHMLDRPELADLIIPDLARWEDWSAMDRLVELFKNADEDSNWVRVPVITYLRACPLDEAKARIEELAKIDPESVKRAEAFYPFAPSGTPAADPTSAPADDSQANPEKAPPGGASSAVLPSATESNRPAGGGLLAATFACAAAAWAVWRGGKSRVA